MRVGHKDITDEDIFKGENLNILCSDRFCLHIFRLLNTILKETAKQYFHPDILGSSKDQHLKTTLYSGLH